MCDEQNWSNEPPGILCELAFFEIDVDDIHTQWMEDDRKRQWNFLPMCELLKVTYDEALELVANKIMREAVRNCSLKPTP
ncbi:hypothetical protein H4R33_007080 [Dimargaris cristalligena]|nr:hypothetical protein H4R33_007080 [Dimargaris cristalligena]